MSEDEDKKNISDNESKIGENQSEVENSSTDDSTEQKTEQISDNNQNLQPDNEPSASEKEITPEKLSEKKPGEVLKLAVKRMLPSGALAKKQLSKLKIYSGADHPHSAQNPKVIEISKLNEKNIVRN